jgi:uncharacterized protein
MKKLLALLPIILLISVAYASHLPSPTGHVNDFAGILTNAQGIESLLSSYERKTGIEIAVVTIDSLPKDQTLFTYGVELFEEWGIGKKGEDNGLLILLNKGGEPGNRMRIEVGYGLQGYITGAEAGRMLDAALPMYEKGDYQAGLETIIGMVFDELSNYSTSNPAGPGEEIGSGLLIFILFAVFLLAVMMVILFLGKERCPICGSTDIQATGDNIICRKCKHKTKRRRNYTPLVLLGGLGGGYGRGGGFGGFGGGGSGGGGAGR